MDKKEAPKQEAPKKECQKVKCLKDCLQNKKCLAIGIASAVVIVAGGALLLGGGAVGTPRSGVATAYQARCDESLTQYDVCPGKMTRHLALNFQVDGENNKVDYIPEDKTRKPISLGLCKVENVLNWSCKTVGGVTSFYWMKDGQYTTNNNNKRDQSSSRGILPVTQSQWQKIPVKK
jgi:hypothetical protein